MEQNKKIERDLEGVRRNREMPMPVAPGVAMSPRVSAVRMVRFMM
jgi:hypothetical protein